MYRAPAVQKVTEAKLKPIAEKLGYDLSDDDLQQYTGLINDMCTDMDRICELQEPGLPVLYPRKPGIKPPPEENPYGAWAVKTVIHGEPTGPLAGKTVVIKDHIAVAGVPMMNGSHVFEGYIPEYDATIVTRILQAGGTILGKAVCEDLCYSGGSATSVSGPVLNPKDTTRMAGGSSSGCGVLVVTGEADLAVGGDQGGSVRMPCWCGSVGMKPTYGLVPYTGAFSMDPCIDHLGPMATNVRDCALLLQVIAGYDDGLDHRQRYGVEVPKYSELLTGNVKGLRIGLLKEAFSLSTEEVSGIVRQAAQTFVELGATVEEVSAPMHLDGNKILSGIVRTGLYSTVQENMGGATSSHHGWHSTSFADHLGAAFKTKSNELSPVLKTMFLIAELMKDYNKRFYSKCLNLVRPLRAGYNALLEADYDLLLMPTLPMSAPKIPEKTTNIPDFFDAILGMLCNTGPFNMTGHPALTFNAGNTPGGLPVGMQLVGKHYDEVTVLNAGHAFEVAKGHSK